MKKEKLSLRAWMFFRKITPAALTKNISLRAWMFLNIAPSALLGFVYWTNVRTHSHPMSLVVTLIIFGFFAVFNIFSKRTDLFDESAKENLRRTDSICLKTAYALGVLIVFLAATSTRLFPIVELPRVTGALLGYCIIFLILLLSILRAVVFSVIDRRGI